MAISVLKGAAMTPNPKIKDPNGQSSRSGLNLFGVFYWWFSFVVWFFFLPFLLLFFFPSFLEELLFSFLPILLLSFFQVS
jgi:hypothetical protein